MTLFEQVPEGFVPNTVDNFRLTGFAEENRIERFLSSLDFFISGLRASDLNDHPAFLATIELFKSRVAYLLGALLGAETRLIGKPEAKTLVRLEENKINLKACNGDDRVSELLADGFSGVRDFLREDVYKRLEKIFDDFKVKYFEESLGYELPIKPMIASLADELAYGNIADRAWKPDLKPDKAQDVNYNAVSVRNALDALWASMADDRRIGRHLQIPTIPATTVRFTEKVVQGLNLLRRIAHIPGTERAREIFAFLLGPKDNSNILIDEILIPPFSYRGDIVDFTLTLAGARTDRRSFLYGTHHIHPGGAEWEVFSDMDLANALTDFSYFGDRDRVCFNSIQPVAGSFAAFPHGSRLYREALSNHQSGFGISPVEGLRAYRLPYVNL